MSMDNPRPDPQALLALASQEERRRSQGRLRLFLGAAPGVGKTYAMLEAAQARRTEGQGVLVGVVETHGRPETQALLNGLEVLPRRRLDHSGHVLEEFDLEAALERHPDLLLVDELAHTNLAGTRHPKRWQDVLELLERGMDVYTTLNVQHLESQSDLVTAVSGVAIRETVPDSLLERADTIVLVDLPPEDLLERLREGKVYVPAQAEWAAENFFREANLTALRELAMRAAARRVNTEVLTWHGQTRQSTWPTSERLLVCVGPAPSSADLVRAAKRQADELKAPWFALYVETPAQASLSAAERNRAMRNLQLAQRLGAETMTLGGEDVAEEVVGFARAHNVSRILIGKPLSRTWRERLLGNFVDRLIRQSGEIDVHIIRPRGLAPLAAGRPTPTPALDTPPWRHGTGALAIWGLATLVCQLVRHHLELSNLVMVYLLGVTVTAVLWGRWPAIASSVLSVAAFDFFFVPPFGTFAVADTQYVVTFAVMLAVALVISTLATRLREQEQTARLLQRRSEIMHSLSAQLARQRGAQNLLAVAVQRMGELFDGQIVGLLADERQHLVPSGGQEGASPLADAKERGVAQWAFDLGQAAGWGTENLPYCQSLYVPLLGLEGPVGVLQLRPHNPTRLLSPEQSRLLISLAGQLALTLEVERLEQKAQQARLAGEAERMRSSLLGAVTHDFQTPLAAVMGSASSMMELGSDLPREKIMELAENIYDEAERLSRLINNLLRVTRLQAGALALQRELQPLEEVVGAALNQLERGLAGRELRVDLPADLPLVSLDGPLMEQVFVNLLENALKYTPAGGGLGLRAWVEGPKLQIELADQGPGLAPKELEDIFDLFQRGEAGHGRPGHGMGLAICKAIVVAHGGRIWAANQPGKGASFRMELPLPTAGPLAGKEA